VAVSGAATLGGNVTTTGNQSYGSTTLAADVTLATANSAISFIGAVDSQASQAKSLTLTAGTGNLTFSGAVGGGVNGRLGTITINSASDVTAAAVTATALTQVAGSGTTTLNGAVNTNGAGGVSLTSKNLAVSQSITTTNGGGVTATQSGTLSTAAAGDISSDGTVSLTSAGALTGAGDITTTNDNVAVTSTAANVALTGAIASGSGAVTIAAATGATMAAVSTSGNLGVTATAGDIIGSGALGVGGNSTFTANGANASIGVSDAANAFTGTVTFAGGSLNNVSVTDTAGGLALNVPTLSGNLAATSSGVLTQSAALTVGGATTLSAPGQAITLTNAANNFTGTVKATGAVTQITDVNALTAELTTTGSTTLSAGGNLAVSGTVSGAGNDLTTTTTGKGSTSFGATTVADALSVTSVGAVSQTGALSVGGATTLSAAGQAITLTNAANDFTGTVTSTGAATQITDTNALTAVFTSTGSTTLTAGGDLVASGTVSGAGNDLTTTTTGKGSTSLGATTVADALSATSAGAVSQSGALTVGGLTTVSAAGQAVTLADKGNDFTGAVSLTGGTTQITDKNGLTLGTLDTGALTATSTGAMNLGQGKVGGALTATSGGFDITQTGGLAVTGYATVDAGTANVTLQNAANDFASSSSPASEFTATGADKEALFGNVFTGTTVQLRDANGITGTVKSTDLNLASVGTTHLYLRNILGAGKAGVGDATIDTGDGNLYLSGSESGFKGRSLVLDNVGQVITDAPGQTFRLDPGTQSVEFRVGGQSLSAVSSLFNVVGGDTVRSFLAKIFTPTDTTTLNGLQFKSFTDLSNAFAPTLILPSVNDAERRSQERAAGIGALKERVQRGSVAFEELVAPVPYDTFKVRQAPCSQEQSEGAIGGKCQ
jgi:hypothetical protein